MRKFWDSQTILIAPNENASDDRNTSIFEDLSDCDSDSDGLIASVTTNEMAYRVDYPQTKKTLELSGSFESLAVNTASSMNSGNLPIQESRTNNLSSQNTQTESSVARIV